MFWYNNSMARRRKRSQLSSGVSSVHEPRVSTYQTRISGYSEVSREAGDAALAAYAGLYGRLQRELFAYVAAGGAATSFKKVYVASYGIPGRMFNAIRVSL